MNYKKVYPIIFLTLFCLLPYLFNGLGRNDTPPEIKGAQNDFTVLLYRKQSKEVEEIPLKEYLCGVVSAEMQANFESEALKAQAVAACSYTMYRYEHMKNNPDADNAHPGAYVCDDYTHCKSYLSKEEAKKRWGADWFEKYYGNIEAAVNQVYGQVITYDGKVINAVFHAISSGTTESAENVWGSSVPYLVSVDSAIDTDAEGYETQVHLTVNEVRKILSSAGLLNESEPKEWFSMPTLNSAGSVKTIDVCSKTLTGVEFRKLFSLRSTSFTVSLDDNRFTFTVHGYGHQVGMSQNGANALAKKGKSYTEILTHYYQGVDIQNYKF